MFHPQPMDIVVIVLIAILIFGANRLPEVARSLGKAIRGFKEELVGQNKSETPKT